MQTVPPLAPRAVHIWHVSLAAADMSAEAPLGHLSDPERVRASAFIHLPSRARFVGARAAVRGILSAYLGNAPHAVSITMDDRGKPRVLGGPCFNVSHSADRVVVAVSVTEVGVDIEAIEDRPGLPGIANRFLADGEVAALRHHSADAFAPAFYGCWTRKESLTKAVGLGLALPLRSFTVSVPPEPARLVSSSDDRLVADAWTLRDLAPGDGFAAALAASGSVDNLIEREWRWGSLEEQHA